MAELLDMTLNRMKIIDLAYDAREAMCTDNLDELIEEKEDEMYLEREKASCERVGEYFDEEYEKICIIHEEDTASAFKIHKAFREYNKELLMSTYKDLVDLEQIKRLFGGLTEQELFDEGITEPEILEDIEFANENDLSLLA
jgi:hypothetical protein